ncbi:MAG: hypothetical protein ACM3KR_04245 [Deltaproteobacteria bacterium]
MKSDYKRLLKLQSQNGSSLILVTSIIFFIIAIAFTLLFMSLTYYTLNKRFEASENLYFETARATPVTAKLLNECISSNFVNASAADLWWNTSSDMSPRFTSMTTDFWNSTSYKPNALSLPAFRDAIGPILERKTSDGITIRQALEDIYLKMLANEGTGTTNIFCNNSVYGAITSSLPDKINPVTYKNTERFKVSEGAQESYLVPGGTINNDAIAWLEEVLNPTAGPYTDGSYPVYDSIMKQPSYITYKVTATNPTYNITKKVEYKFEAYSNSSILPSGGGGPAPVGGAGPNGDSTGTTYSYPLFSNVFAAAGKINFNNTTATTINGGVYAFGAADGGVSFNGGNVTINGNNGIGRIVTRGDILNTCANALISINKYVLCDNFQNNTTNGTLTIGVGNGDEYLSTFGVAESTSDTTTTVNGTYYNLNSDQQPTNITVNGGSVVSPDSAGNKDAALLDVSFLKAYDDAATDKFSGTTRETEYTDALNVLSELPTDNVIYGSDTALARKYFIYINNDSSKTINIGTNATGLSGNIKATDIYNYSGIIYSKGDINISANIPNKTGSISGTVATNVSYVTLPSTEVPTTGYYVGCTIKLNSGANKTINAYDGATKKITIAGTWGGTTALNNPTYTITWPNFKFNGAIISNGNINLQNTSTKPIILNDISSTTLTNILNNLNTNWNIKSTGFTIEAVRKFFSPGSVPATTFDAAAGGGGGGGSTSQYVRLLSQREIK